MSVDNGTVFNHPGGRVCTFNGRSWRYGETGQFICMKHPSVEEDDDQDRGEFGMPGLGVGHVFLQEDQITHPPNHSPGPDAMVLTITGSGITVEFQPTGKGYSMDLRDQALRVVHILVRAMEQFIEKNQGYGSTAYALGAKGQYADMNRKMGKLKHTLWDGNEAVGESEVEMLMDLIGHAGLTIDFLNQEGTA